jgi:hypothetical protein
MYSLSLNHSLLWEVGGQLAFSRASVYQNRNAHNYLRDMKEEEDLYLQAGKIIDFPFEWKPPLPLDRRSSMFAFFEVAIPLSYDSGFWGFADVLLTESFTADLASFGYIPPPLVPVNLFLSDCESKELLPR